MPIVTDGPSAGNDEQNLGVYAALSFAEISEALASRERYEVERAIELAPPIGAEISAESNGDEALRGRISDRAYNLIIDLETGGRAYYESPHGINKRPVWPAGQSGVTIGCGYDLGYYRRAEFEDAWGSRLSPQDVTILAGALGLKGPAARNFMPRVSHIVIEWGVALSIFDIVNLPREIRRTLSHLPGATQLHPHCIGALVSLVFNRGASFSLAGDRYREMREIRRLIEAGEADGVPSQLRAMKRLWQGTGQGGLLIRRDKEAQLFQDGLDAVRIARQAGDVARNVRGGHRTAEAVTAEADPDLSWLEALTQDQLDNVLYGAEVEEGGASALDSGAESAARRYSKSDVRWVSNDRNHPDYAHLPPDAKGQSFIMSADDLDVLIRCNRFQPHTGAHGMIIFALRGAMLNGPGHSQEHVSELRLIDARPDHVSFRCVIGVYDTGSRKLSAYAASTVCNAGGVVSCYNYYNGFSSLKQGNILLTGCYEMCVGTHFGSVAVPGVFRLGNGPGPGSASKHTVLRTGNDVTFGTQDIWDPCTPQDNLHPAFGNASFSSLGCLTVRGTYSGGHQGEWKMFRAAAGLQASQDAMGTRYDMVLLSGLEAATAALLRNRNIVDGPELDEILGCLRQGSRGDQVSQLQTKLGMSPSGTFDWSTAKKLSEHQAQVLGWATGTYGRSMDVLLGFEIFGSVVQA